MSKMQLWKQFKIANCHSHHVLENSPVYSFRFNHVMKFHPPGVAPVIDDSGAYHIDEQGNEIYQKRFVNTFGYYEEIAAVASEQGWFHIDLLGKSLYDKRYLWCGNFQEGKCLVQDQDKKFFHIDRSGTPLYERKYSYAGDFKDGIAVVQRPDGMSTHIDESGKEVHSHWFNQLDVFHKGFARAQDDQGWFHIKTDGFPAYKERYADLEPFYNGRAHVQTFERDLMIIDETGKVSTILYKSPSNALGNLSGELVGFWKSETMRLAVEMKVLDRLPLSSSENTLEILLRALWEIGVVKKENDVWTISEKGKLLTSDSFMGEATLMWKEVEHAWENLPLAFQEETPKNRPTFKEKCSEKEKLSRYQKVLEGYSKEDFSAIAAWPLWEKHQTITFLGQTGITLCQEVLKNYPSIQAIVLNRDLPIYRFNTVPRLETVFQDPLSPWNIKCNALVLPRYLHYFPDQEALQILTEGHRALKDNGKIYLFEMIIDPEKKEGGLMALNMFAESRGKLRSKKEWEALLMGAGFKISSFETIKPYLHAITGEKNG